jgi:DNA-binding transcriptional ArsR family regulator
MGEGLLALIEESKSLNSDVFSLTRLQLLSSLAALSPESVTYRELKAALKLSDGALYSNLKVLGAMGYITSATVTVEEKKLEAYQLTGEGRAEWERVREWLKKFLDFGGIKHEKH